ncbi:predicted protein [Sclerotinia sclerotiorum 1980 UF-70]|uniref:Uncharacterized protein n=2 Tax=Sclerotinia sclerotiorum (strain ATCC 18683 / 1980 / Ss-1) TaxID=665079 RepID=A7EM25_SCLS1|nr:predicted protein [Sclerotinia sclerotiorum 1980 UF-70]APA14470.1 hypothetical protein sscle_13g092400 [Sclerotinia sclerotiorum 1980 UF-70]EDO03891.1 predicted protein [Sclerotinia sclerotiorum 1980 UF-70]
MTGKFLFQRAAQYIDLCLLSPETSRVYDSATYNVIDFHDGNCLRRAENKTDISSDNHMTGDLEDGSSIAARIL